MIKTVFYTLIINILTTFEGNSQKIIHSYRNYQIVWDTTEQKSFLFNSKSNTKIKIPFDEAKYDWACRFENGFVQVKQGDMKALMKLDGTKMLSMCHFINFYPKDSLMVAWICQTGWILLNFKGDTLQFQKNKAFEHLSNSVPIVNGNIFAARAENYMIGYLNKKGVWVIKPQYEEVRDFENNFAKVKQNGKWGLIDSTGTVIIEPQYDNEKFKVK